MPNTPKKGFSLSSIRGSANQRGLKINSTYAMGSAFYRMAEQKRTADKAEEARNEELFGEVKVVKKTKEEREMEKMEREEERERKRVERERVKMEKEVGKERARIAKAKGKGGMGWKGKGRKEGEDVQAVNVRDVDDDHDEQEVTSMAKTKKAPAMSAAPKAVQSANPTKVDPTKRNKTSRMRPTPAVEEESEVDDAGLDKTNGYDVDVLRWAKNVAASTPAATSTAASKAVTAAPKAVKKPVSKRTTTTIVRSVSEDDEESQDQEVNHSETDADDELTNTTAAPTKVAAPKTIYKPISKRTPPHNGIAKRAQAARTKRRAEHYESDEESESSEPLAAKAKNNKKAMKPPPKPAAPKRPTESYQNDEESEDSEPLITKVANNKINTMKPLPEPTAPKATKQPIPNKAAATWQGTTNRAAATKEVPPKPKVNAAASTKRTAVQSNRAARPTTVQPATAAPRPVRRAGAGTQGVKPRGTMSTHEARPFFSDDEDDDEESDGMDWLGLGEVKMGPKKPQTQATAGGGKRGVARKVEKRGYVTVSEEESSMSEDEDEGNGVGPSLAETKMRAAAVQSGLTRGVASKAGAVAKKRQHVSDDEDVSEGEVVKKKGVAVKKPAMKKARGGRALDVVESIE